MPKVFKFNKKFLLSNTNKLAKTMVPAPQHKTYGQITSVTEKQINRYRPEIDGLRAIAVLSVVWHHFFPGQMPGGFLGVDIFFVISGYVITNTLIKNKHSPTLLVDFYLRRARRLLPALIFVLVFTHVFAYFALLPDEYKRLSNQIISGALFFTNLTEIGVESYFDVASAAKPLLHLWSLGVEEQFYVMWPLFIILFNRRRVNFAVIISALCLASYVAWCVLAGINQNFAFYSPLTRFWELGLGAMVSLFQRLPTLQSYKKSLWGEVSSIVGLIAIIYSVSGVSGEFPYVAYFTILPVMGAVMVIMSGCHSAFNRFLLQNNPIVFIGKISYPLYLWHWPLFSMIYIIDDNNVPDRNLLYIILGVSVFLAALTYMFVERPIRAGRWGRDKRVVIVSAASLAAIVAGSVFVIQSQGMPGRNKSSDELVKIINAPQYPRISELTCKERSEILGLTLHPQTECVLSHDDIPDIFFIGDSHMLQYREAVWRKFSDAKILFLTHPSCLPFSSKGGEPTARVSQAEIDRCRHNFDEITRYFYASTETKTVVLTGFYSYLLAGDFSVNEGNVRLPSEEVDRARVGVFMERAVELLKSLDRPNFRVILMRDIPFLNFNIYRCFDARPLRVRSRQTRHDCNVYLDEHNRRISASERVMTDLLSKFPNVQVFDPTSVLCKEGKCSALLDGKPIYRNGDHLNSFGAELVIRRFRSWYDEKNNLLGLEDR